MIVIWPCRYFGILISQIQICYNSTYIINDLKTIHYKFDINQYILNHLTIFVVNVHHFAIFVLSHCSHYEIIDWNGKAYSENFKLKNNKGKQHYRYILQTHPLCFCHMIKENHIYCKKKPLIYYIHFANSILYSVPVISHSIYVQEGNDCYALKTKNNLENKSLNKSHSNNHFDIFKILTLCFIILTTIFIL